MTPIEADFDPLEEVAEEFLERIRRGERPSIAEYVSRHPARAAEVRDLLAAMTLVENLKPDPDETLDHIDGRKSDANEPPLERLGDYRIIREVGRGGMGIVYEAEQESLGRRVALKVLTRRANLAPAQVARFLREARSAAQLHHTNIVPVFGVGDDDGLHYYAMQFIRGASLDAILAEMRRSQCVPFEEALTRTGSPDALSTITVQADLIQNENLTSRGTDSVAASHDNPGDRSLSSSGNFGDQYARTVARIGLQVAQALDYAHSHGVLHRDIKPSNLLIDAQGTAWVTDFGLAKAVEDDDLTRTGDVVGTLRYMAPERFRGDCDARSDVYALGLTLYELLARQPAFASSDRNRLIYEVTQLSPPRLRSLDKHIPRDLETIIHKAIEREPAHRYQAANEFARDLASFLEDRPINARRTSAAERLVRWTRRNTALATLITIVALLLVAMTVGATTSAWHLSRKHAEAVAAAYSAKKELWESLLARAKASRLSDQPGRRFDSLAFIADAARLDVYRDRQRELRDAAIAALALVDVRRVPDTFRATSSLSIQTSSASHALNPTAASAFGRPPTTRKSLGSRRRTYSRSWHISARTVSSWLSGGSNSVARNSIYGTSAARNSFRPLRKEPTVARSISVPTAGGSQPAVATGRSICTKRRKARSSGEFSRNQCRRWSASTRRASDWQ